MAWEWEEQFGLQLAQIEDTVAMRQSQAEAEMRRQMAEAQQAEQQRLATPPAGIMLPNGRVHLPQPDKEKQDE
jgi:fumarylacetoacetate (FAA) hydrolase family protein